MRAVVKGLSCDEFDVQVFQPDDPACFYLSLRLRIGLADSSGADDFELYVCTPGWLSQSVLAPQSGRHLLIVREFDLQSIEKWILDYVNECHGHDWGEIALKLARVFAWEFEDYQSA